MKTFIQLIVACLLSQVNIAQANTWTQKADFGGVERWVAVGFSIGDKGYIGTGSSLDHTSYYKDFWEFDPLSNTWTQKADFGGGLRDRAVGFSIGSKGYLGTGLSSDNSFMKDFWEYDPASNTWTRKADFGGVGRYGAFAFSTDTKGYVGTGDVSTYPYHSKDFWEYDPASNIWTKKADFGGIARQYSAAFAINGKGYAGTGYNGSRLKDFWEYNPTADKWTQKADFGGGGRNGVFAFSINEKGYIGAGENPSFNVFKDFWEYDPATDAWTRKADVDSKNRDFAVGFSIGNKGYTGTGAGDSYQISFKDFWEYTPAVCIAPDVPGAIKGQKSDLCGGGKFYYKVDAVPGALYYTWSVPANTSIIAGQGSNTIVLKINSNFKGGNLSVTANNSCGSSDPSTAVLNVKPFKPSAIDGPSIVSAFQQGIVFSVNDKGVVYNWSLVPVDAVITSGWSTNKITVTWGSTSGYVAVSASNACGLSEIRTKAVALSTIAGTTSGDNLVGVNVLPGVYPNPVTNICIVKFTAKKQGNYTISITDVTGKPLQLKKGIATAGQNSILLDVSKFTNGMYFINISDQENGRRTLKLQKE